MEYFRIIIWVSHQEILEDHNKEMPFDHKNKIHMNHILGFLNQEMSSVGIWCRCSGLLH